MAIARPTSSAALPERPYRRAKALTVRSAKEGKERAGSRGIAPARGSRGMEAQDGRSRSRVPSTGFAAEAETPVDASLFKADLGKTRSGSAVDDFRCGDEGFDASLSLKGSGSVAEDRSHSALSSCGGSRVNVENERGAGDKSDWRCRARMVSTIHFRLGGTFMQPKKSNERFFGDRTETMEPGLIESPRKRFAIGRFVLGYVLDECCWVKLDKFGWSHTGFGWYCGKVIDRCHQGTNPFENDELL